MSLCAVSELCFTSILLTGTFLTWLKLRNELVDDSGGSSTERCDRIELSKKLCNFPVMQDPFSFLNTIYESSLFTVHLSTMRMLVDLIRSLTIIERRMK